MDWFQIIGLLLSATTALLTGIPLLRLARNIKLTRQRDGTQEQSALSESTDAYYFLAGLVLSILGVALAVFAASAVFSNWTDLKANGGIFPQLSVYAFVYLLIVLGSWSTIKFAILRFKRNPKRAEPKLSTTWFLRLVSVGLLLIGALFAIGHYENAHRVWLTTPGRITSSEPVRVIGKSADDTLYYKLTITYSYTVSEQVHKGTRLNDNANRIGYSEKAAVATATLYAAGRVCDVHYDENDPNFSIIELSPVRPERLWLAVVLIVLGSITFISTLVVSFTKDIDTDPISLQSERFRANYSPRGSE